MSYRELKNMLYACLKSETQNPRYGFRFRVTPYISYKPSYMKKSFISKTKKKYFSQEILEPQSLISFKQFLIQESKNQLNVDDELRNIRNDIRVTKSRILLKHLIRKHKILKDVERSTSTKTGFLM